MQTTKSLEHVTNRQGVQLAQKARENGVTRKNWLEFTSDPVKLANLFDEMKNGDNWFEKLQIEASKIGARVHLLRAKVDYSKTHNKAAMAGGPQTGSGWDVLRVGDIYQSPESKVVEEDIVLLNYFQDGANYQKTVEWGLSNGLSKTIPHVPFAIGEQFPEINYILGQNPMYVIETTGCLFNGLASACDVCWGDALRMSRLNWQRSLGISHAWFAFLKK